VELARLLADITPGDLSQCVRATGGTEAVEIALQVAMVHTGRRGFVSIEGSYHGNSLGTMSVASSDNREQFPNLLPHCRKVKPPLDAKAAERVDRLLRKRDVAAFIMEPVICNLGVQVPDAGFMSELQRLCKRYGTLLIADEVACGFGRTGKLFASEHFDLRPDMMCLSKAITGGYAGLGATVIADKVARSVRGEFGAWSTYGWHPLAVDVALANLRHILKHRTRLLANVERMGAYFAERLSRMKFRSPATVRAKGLALGVEFESEDYASKLEARCRRAGLLVHADDDVMLLFPALNIDRETARRGLDLLEESV
jgi:adenosylmethionine-8-amino-7-oxononanoate aminotransferase